MSGHFSPVRPGVWLAPADGPKGGPEGGPQISHQEVLRRAASAPAVLLGEQHDKAAQHRWQLHVAAGLLALRPGIVMGFEMFPARLDPVLARWVAGELSEAEFLEQAEWGTVWGFPAELYLPLFRFCRQFAIPMHGLNCRRALVSEVGREGWEAIAEENRDGLTPAVPATPAYRQYLFQITGGGAPNRKAAGPEDPAFDRFVRAQQVWDRSFACRIAALRNQPEPPLVIGIIGRGHLEFGHGTPAQLADLGITGTQVLLPHLDPAPPAAGIAHALFCLDPEEV